MEIEHAVHALEGAAEFHSGITQRECRVNQVFAGIVWIGLYGEARRSGRWIVLSHSLRQRNIGGTDLDKPNRMQTSLGDRKDPDTVLGAIPKLRILSCGRQRKI